MDTCELQLALLPGSASSVLAVTLLGSWWKMMVILTQTHTWQKQWTVARVKVPPLHSVGPQMLQPHCSPPQAWSLPAAGAWGGQPSSLGQPAANTQRSTRGSLRVTAMEAVRYQAEILTARKSSTSHLLPRSSRWNSIQGCEYTDRASPHGSAPPPASQNCHLRPPSTKGIARTARAILRFMSAFSSVTEASML